MFRTSDFDVDAQIVHNFFHSPLVSIAEAVGSPLRRQISLKVSNNMYTSTIHLAIQYSSLVAPMLKDHQLKHQLTLTTYVCTTTTPVDHRSLFKCRRTTGVQNYTILNFNIFSISKQMRFVSPLTGKLTGKASDMETKERMKVWLRGAVECKSGRTERLKRSLEKRCTVSAAETATFSVPLESTIFHWYLSARAWTKVHW